MPFEDNNVNYKIGDTWLLTGPSQYVPRQEVKKIKAQKALTIEENCGLLLECTKNRENRKVGER